MKRVALFCLAGWGCFPVLTHGPRVTKGGELTFGGVVAAMSTDSPTTKFGAFPNIDLGAAVGTTPEAWNGGGIRVGGQIGLLYGALDVYHQFSSSLTGDTPAGVGAILMAGTRTGVMPYFMIGDLFGSHAYLTQGVAAVRSTPEAPLNALSVTTLGVEWAHSEGWYDKFFVTVLLGHQTRCFTGGLFCDNWAPVAIAGFAVSAPPRLRRGPWPPGVPRPTPPRLPPARPPVRSPT